MPWAVAAGIIIICYVSWGTLEVDTDWKDAETIDVSLNMRTHLPFKAAVISPVDNYSTLLEVFPLPGAKEYNVKHLLAEKRDKKLSCKIAVLVST